MALRKEFDCLCFDLFRINMVSEILGVDWSELILLSFFSIVPLQLQDRQEKLARLREFRQRGFKPHSPDLRIVVGSQIDMYLGGFLVKLSGIDVENFAPGGCQRIHISTENGAQKAEGTTMKCCMGLLPLQNASGRIRTRE